MEQILWNVTTSQVLAKFTLFTTSTNLYLCFTPSLLFTSKSSQSEFARFVKHILYGNTFSTMNIKKKLFNHI